MKILCIALVVGAAWNCQAKLGETVKQIEVRYGAPINCSADEKDPREKFCIYNFQDNKISVTFLDAKCESETLVPVDAKKKFTDEECLALAKSLSGRTDWKKDIDNGMTSYWHTEKSEVQMFRYRKPTGPDQLGIVNHAILEKRAADKKDKAK
jgi:hypothetical protein